jgi:hypothetical protein
MPEGPEGSAFAQTVRFAIRQGELTGKVVSTTWHAERWTKITKGKIVHREHRSPHIHACCFLGCPGEERTNLLGCLSQVKCHRSSIQEVGIVDSEDYTKKRKLVGLYPRRRVTVTCEQPEYGEQYENKVFAVGKNVYWVQKYQGNTFTKFIRTIASLVNRSL